MLVNAVSIHLMRWSFIILKDKYEMEKRDEITGIRKKVNILDKEKLSEEELEEYMLGEEDG